MSSVSESPASLRPRLRRCMSMGSEGGTRDGTVGQLKNCKTNINNAEQQNTFAGLMLRDVPLTDDRISDSDTDPAIPFYYMPWVMGAGIYLFGLLFLFHWIG